MQVSEPATLALVAPRSNQLRQQAFSIVKRHIGTCHFYKSSRRLDTPFPSPINYCNTVESLVQY
jgi:hypothetical protein